MDIEKFVSETLTQIISGVKKAQENPNNLGADINPLTAGLGTTSEVQNLVFDIAVSVEESSTAGAEGKISVLGSKVGGGGSMSASEKSASRVKFVVPLRLPDKGRKQ